jgi:hypothetical protein
MRLQINIVSIAVIALLSGTVAAQNANTQSRHSGHSTDSVDSDLPHAQHEQAGAGHHHEGHAGSPDGGVPEATDNIAMLTVTDAIEAALSEGGEPIVADVLGVVCDFCALAMNKIFGKRDEVAALYVDLDTKALSLVLKPGASLSNEAIADLAIQAGYRVADVRRGKEALGDVS